MHASDPVQGIRTADRRRGGTAWLPVGLAAVVCMTAGCLTVPEGKDKDDDAVSIPLSRDEIQTFYARAKDPREFWITVYTSQTGPVFRGDHRTHQYQVETLEFMVGDQHDIPVIETKTGRLHLHPFLIDTTSAESWVDLETATAMRLAPIGMPAYNTLPVHVEDDVPGLLCVASTLKAGLLHVESVLMFVRAATGPLGPLARGVTDPVPNGVLGTRFLDALRYVQFDFPNRSVELASTTAYKPDSNRLLASAPFSIADGYLTVEASVDGRPTTLVVDTAGDYSIGLPGMEGTLVRQLRIADLEVENLTASATVDPDFALTDRARVGTRFLSRFTVTLDMQQRIVHFEAPSP